MVALNRLGEVAGRRETRLGRGQHARPPPRRARARAVLKGHRLERAESGHRTRKATPITPSVLGTLIGALALSTRCRRRDRAVLLPGFALGTRRSTLARLNVGEVRAVDAYELEARLRRSKTDKTATGDGYPSASDTPMLNG